MPLLITHKLSFQLSTGEWLFQDVDFSLENGLTGLVGRNGAGKSVFIALLLGKLKPTQGQVTCRFQPLHYSQLVTKQAKTSETICDFLGISDKLLALNAIEQGNCKPAHFDLIGDDWDIKKQTQITLKSLRISADLHANCDTLSGGQLALLRLHKLFEAEAKILLLDEPSNHLDTEGKNWLVQKMKNFDGQILLVSHDSKLLMHVNNIYQLSSLGLQCFKGNYSQYLAQSSHHLKVLEKKITDVKSTRIKLKQQAQTNKEKAQQREAQGNKIRKSGSQPKILMDAMKDKSARSLSSKLVAQQHQLARNQEQLTSLQTQIEIQKPQTLNLQSLNQVNKRMLLHIKNCRLHFGLRKSISLTLSPTQKCHLSGANGSGKSTLLSAIQGQHSHYSGLIKLATTTVYLDQNFDFVALDKSVLECFMDNNQLISESVARILLAGIGFRQNMVYRKLAMLSGGEKMKLSMLMVSQVVNSPLLLLDEPDNHLDTESKHILMLALRAYKGAFIIVSHDQDFVDKLGINKHVLMS
jgi:ATPase subunit of ABC transporter with duplicated ATPase domains